MSFCILNGKLSQSVNLVPEDRGLAYGDGIFETMVVKHGIVRFEQEHISRLKEGAKVLGFFPDRPIEDIIIEQIPHAVKINRLDEATAKVIMWRKPGGIFTPDSDGANFLATCRPFKPAPPEKKTVSFAENIGKEYSPFSRFKTISSLPYILAGQIMKKKEVDDVILVNSSGKLMETLRANLFWIKDGKVYTPSVKTGCVEGIMRKKIITFCKKEKIPFSEGSYTKKDVLAADFAFSSNVGGVSLIRSVEDAVFQKSSPVFDRIRKESDLF